MTNWKESKQKFLDRWPLEEVESLTLDEYTNIDRDDSFTYWIESRTSDVIGVGGGSAFKFGIFRRDPKAKEKEPQSGQMSDPDRKYGWYEKYGTSPQEAFSKIKELLIKTIKASLLKNFEEIDGIELGHSFKWKVAYMYAPENSLLRIVKDQALNFLSLEILNKKIKNPSEIYKKLLDAKPEGESLENYSERLWSIFERYKKKLKEKKSNNDITVGKLESKPNFKAPLNQILFGPPGTGKTYSTILAAVKIINPDFVNNHTWKEIKQKFDELVKAKQIVFTTFHQSMAYEDFVEGIKPVEPEKEGDSVSYKVEEGIFKKICIEATFALAKENISASINHVIDFSLAYDRFLLTVEEKLSSGELVELPTKQGGRIIIDGISSQGNILVKHVGGSRLYTISKSRLLKLQEGIIDIEDVNNINDEFRAVIGGNNSSAYWSVLKSIQEQSLKTGTNKVPEKYLWSDKVQVVNSLQISELLGKSAQPYILIIDEINRGNVSAIFGELITLIEDSKRSGNDEALEITLPYSKEKFSVPNNLYIIGTMNTADRSVEALDSALRRRFSFEEVQPDSSLISQPVGLKVDLIELLDAINKRIEILLDKDHLIGHSYFMKVTDLKSLQNALYNQIIPLLKEYFFGDYGKISMVLGEGFCKGEKVGNRDNIFASTSSDYDDPDYSEKMVYQFPASKTEDDFLEAIDLLLLKK